MSQEMILELDAGNTRIKWRLRQQSSQGQWLKVADGSVFAQQKTPSVFIELGKQLEKLPLEHISRLLVASVRGEGFKGFFSSVMTEKWHLQPEYAVSAPAFGTLRNGYQEPARLGVDRWLALVAARAEAAELPCCVVDCGTTITVDLVSAAGQHLGGYIVPGLQLMRESLAGRSRALATLEEDWEQTVPGVSTNKAVHNGILAMVLGFLRSIRAGPAGQAPCQWFLTGGDARILASNLDWECRLEPDLVLDGLALAMSGRGSGQ